MSRSPSHRLRFLLGLALAGALGLGLGFVLLRQAREGIGSYRDERRAVVALQALVDVIQRSELNGERIREAVSAWQEGHPELARIRVVLLADVSLEASTAPEDRGEQAAPRRLSREEQPLYVRAQRLQAAVDTNREEGSARKAELELEQLPSGGLSLAAPIEQDGGVAGLVEAEVRPPSGSPASLGWFVLVVWLLPVGLLGLLSPVLGERRVLLAASAVVLLAAALGFYQRHTVATLEADRRAAEEAVVQQLRHEAARAAGLLERMGVKAGTPLAPASWDVDKYRRPRGLLSDAGALDEAHLTAEIEAARAFVAKGLGAAGLAALVLLLGVGLGWLAALVRMLVTHRQAYSYVAPAMVGMVVLVFFPFIYGVALSFTDANIYNSSQSIAETWVGLRNYVEILTDFAIARRGADGSLVFNYLNFYWTALFTVVWTVSNVTIGVTVGLLLALVLNTKGLALRPLYRVLLILPWAMPNYITALVWKGMFHRQYGVINHVLEMLGATPISWFDRPLTSFLTALATNGWLSFPFMMVVSLGALQSIPAELYEAARVDGASRWQQFRSITLPSLKPALVPAIILSVVWTFNMFNIIYLVTQGEPSSSTEILITQAYKFAFEKYRYGYAAAYSTVIFAILLIYGNIQNRLSRATEVA